MRSAACNSRGWSGKAEGCPGLSSGHGTLYPSTHPPIKPASRQEHELARQRASRQLHVRPACACRPPEAPAPHPRCRRRRCYCRPQPAAPPPGVPRASGEQTPAGAGSQPGLTRPQAAGSRGHSRPVQKLRPEGGREGRWHGKGGKQVRCSQRRTKESFLMPEPAQSAPCHHAPDNTSIQPAGAVSPPARAQRLTSSTPGSGAWLGLRQLFCDHRLAAAAALRGLPACPPSPSTLLRGSASCCAAAAAAGGGREGAAPARGALLGDRAEPPAPAEVATACRREHMRRQPEGVHTAMPRSP